MLKKNLEASEQALVQEKDQLKLSYAKVGNFMIMFHLKFRHKLNS